MAEKSREKKKRDTVSAQNLLVLLDMKPPSFHKGGGRSLAAGCPAQPRRRKSPRDSGQWRVGCAEIRAPRHSRKAAGKGRECENMLEG